VAFNCEAATGVSQLPWGNAEDKLRAIFQRQVSSICGPIMIAAANVIPGGTRIDPAKSQPADLFVAEVPGDMQSFIAMSAQH
jgi:hypothetical protein